MKPKLVIKTLFVIILTCILFGLIFIIYDKAGTRAHIYNPVLADYKIVDENESCDNTEEFLYADKNYDYYLPCLSSYNIYLYWTDGDKDLIKDALNNHKVDMASLIEHGLKVNKHERKN